MADTLIPRCEPPVQFCDLPYHWLQWRTPYRCEQPEPWTWHSQERTWKAPTGAVFTPERAEQMHWHYLAPAHIPVTTPRPIRAEMADLLTTWTHGRQLTIPLMDLAKLLSAVHFAVRFKTTLDDTQVRLAVEQDWETIGLPQAYALLQGCGIVEYNFFH